VAALAAGASLAGRALSSSNAATSSGSAAKSSGKKIVKLTALPIGATFNFIHSSQGVPSLLFRTKTGVFAYSSICTHLGCTVAYKSATKKLVCPCHGAEFDPLKSGKVSKGPAETALTKVAVKVKGAWVVEA
jgi:thiosulfate dehydrogenase [quinone] large subunit